MAQASGHAFDWLAFACSLHVVLWQELSFLQQQPQQHSNSNTNSLSGFGGLEVACWLLVPKFVGSHPAEAVRIFRAEKNPQQTGSKAVGPMS